MDNPINLIEDEKTWTDFGRQAYWIYRGAIDSGASEGEALFIVSAFYAGAIHGKREDDDGSSDIQDT